MNFKELAKKLGSRGGKKSVESQFKGKSKAEISEMMSEVRRKKIIAETAKLLGETMNEDYPK